jgi:hypothetical protein
MSAWQKIPQSDLLNQGDLLYGVKIPLVRDSFPEADDRGRVPIDVIDGDIVIMSQSCDLELSKLPNVVVAQFFSIRNFETINPNYKKSGKWGDVLRGRVESLHLLSCPDAPNDRDRTLVIDFRLVVSLPVGYVRRFAHEAGDRWRLQPPSLEALSQAFGHFFSRVAVADDVKI